MPPPTTSNKHGSGNSVDNQHTIAKRRKLTLSASSALVSNAGYRNEDYPPNSPSTIMICSPPGNKGGENAEGCDDASDKEDSGAQVGSPSCPNRSLQDIQLQLQLLENQNKKRLMMARQEQDRMADRTAGERTDYITPNQEDRTQHRDRNSNVYPSPPELVDKLSKNGGDGVRREGSYHPAGEYRASPTENHALEDYESQLRSLEQRNKERLSMARQERQMRETDGNGAQAERSDHIAGGHQAPSAMNHALQSNHMQQMLLERQNKLRLSAARRENQMCLANGNVTHSGGPQSPSVDNHALHGYQTDGPQDYQMQLWILEQQNKQRLLMARRQQDFINSYNSPDETNHTTANQASRAHYEGNQSFAMIPTTAEPSILVRDTGFGQDVVQIEDRSETYEQNVPQSADREFTQEQALPVATENPQRRSTPAFAVTEFGPPLSAAEHTLERSVQGESSGTKPNSSHSQQEVITADGDVVDLNIIAQGLRQFSLLLQSMHSHRDALSRFEKNLKELDKQREECLRNISEKKAKLVELKGSLWMLKGAAPEAIEVLEDVLAEFRDQ